MKKDKPTPTAINPHVGKVQSSFKGIGTIKPKSTSVPTPKKGK